MATEPSSSRSRTVALVAAGLVVAAVTAAIVVFGIVPYPDYPSLAQNPDASIAGLVAFTRDPEDERADGGPCVFVVPASGGEERELGCRFGEAVPEWGGTLGFTADGLLVVRVYTPDGRDGLVALDTERGDVVREASAEPPDLDLRPDPRRGLGVTGRTTHPSDGSTLDFRHGDLIARTDGRDRVLLTAEGPGSYGLQSVQWSPDARWVLAIDSLEQLIVIAADGSSARLLATDASGATWYQPGQTAFAVELPAAAASG